MKKSKKLETHEKVLITLVVTQFILFVLKTIGIILWPWYIVALPIIVFLGAMGLLIIFIIIAAAVMDEGQL